MDIYFINVFYAHGIACAFARSGERGSRSKQTCVSTRCRKPFGILLPLFFPSGKLFSEGKPDGLNWPGRRRGRAFSRRLMSIFAQQQQPV